MLLFCTQHPGILQPFVNANSALFFFFLTHLGKLWGINKSSVRITEDVTLSQTAEIGPYDFLKCKTNLMLIFKLTFG